ncbi:MAG: LytTR family DNA-binding domain-containing protein [Bacteroidota bacterium]|nr:LytTR family DNA-binding domain-containing protein [Bacteroidota bacterium]
MLIAKIIIVSVIPITAMITIRRNDVLRFYLKTAKEINKKFDQKNDDVQKGEEGEKVHFISNYIKDNLTININSLLFIRSANNYVEVFWKENNNVRKKLIRSSLKKVEESLKEYSHIIKCHRTNIVNIQNIKKVIKSAEGDKLFFDNIDFPISVSKKYINQIRELIQKYSLVFI